MSSTPDQKIQGRVRESADGLRSRSVENQRRLREAMDANMSSARRKNLESYLGGEPQYDPADYAD